MRKIIFVAIFATVYSVSVAQTNSSKDLYLTKSFKDAGFKKIDAEPAMAILLFRLFRQRIQK